jgi:hypothetical protein
LTYKASGSEQFQFAAKSIADDARYTLVFGDFGRTIPAVNHLPRPL